MLAFFTIVLQSSLLVAVKAQNQCCPPNGSILFEYASCDNLVSMNLECGKDGIHVLNGTANVNDDFIVLHDGVLRMTDGMIEFPPTDYCINTMEFKDRVALVCSREKYNNGDLPFSFSMISVIVDVLKITSMILLVLIVVIYLIPESRPTLQENCTLHFLINYSLVYFFVNILNFSGVKLCLSKAYLFYFFSISSSIWFCIDIFNMWKIIISQQSSNYIKTYIIYLILSYGGATLLSSLILLIQCYPSDHQKEVFFDFDNCWFKDSQTRWRFYYLPICIILTFSALFLLDSNRRIRTARVQRSNDWEDVIKSNYNCHTQAILFTVIVTSWLLDILLTNFISSAIYFSIFVDFLNSIQGMLIFTIMAVTQADTLKHLITRTCLVCGCKIFVEDWTPVRGANQNHEVMLQVRYSTQRT